MKFSSNYFYPLLAITLMITTCNVGQLNEVYNDSILTSSPPKDSLEILGKYEMPTVTSDTLPVDSRQFISQAENNLSLNIHLSKEAMNQSNDDAITKPWENYI